MNKLFKKPNWLLPELDEPKYYLHVLIIVGVVYALINFLVQPMDITIVNVLLGMVFVTAGDIVAHSVLKLK